MTAEPGGTKATDESVALVRLCEGVIRDFLADPTRNNLGPGASEPAWDDYLLGFAAGDDTLWAELKDEACRGHWTPAEAFAAARSATDAPAGAPRNSKQPATDWAGLPPSAPDDPAGVTPIAADSLTVISWAVCQTEETKDSNRRQTRFPSEPWARARVFGQEANRRLHLALLQALRSAGYEAVAPALVPAWTEVGPDTNDWRSSWSERHVAYVSGLGTFGLSGGLITKKGKAVRFGSVVVRAVVPPSPRPYAGPFAYCLHFSGSGCAECADRCPAGSVSVDGRDKTACARHLAVAEAYITREYGFAGYGCGLCQTAIPCESRIPEGLEPDGLR